jgi:hypothetical protein
MTVLIEHLRHTDLDQTRIAAERMLERHQHTSRASKP